MTIAVAIALCPPQRAIPFNSSLGYGRIETGEPSREMDWSASAMMAIWSVFAFLDHRQFAACFLSYSDLSRDQEVRASPRIVLRAMLNA